MFNVYIINSRTNKTKRTVYYNADKAQAVKMCNWLNEMALSKSKVYLLYFVKEN